MKVFGLIAAFIIAGQVFSNMEITDNEAKNLYQILPTSAVPMGRPIEELAVKIYGQDIMCALRKFAGVESYKCILKTNSIDQCIINDELAQNLFNAMKDKQETWNSDHQGYLWVRKEGPIACSMRVYYKVESGQDEFSCTLSYF